jgi:hypothetical protein
MTSDKSDHHRFPPVRMLSNGRSASPPLMMAAFASGVLLAAGQAPFALDGVADSQGYRLSNAGAGMPLYAAVRGTTIYVATTAPGPGGANDHFIMLDGGVSANPTPAPWAKSGSTPFRSAAPFLGAESGNNYIGWFNADAHAYRGAGGSLMEGTIDRSSVQFQQKLNLLICALAYQSDDGGVLVDQTPALISNSGNVDSLELLSIPIDAIRDEDANGVFDRLDPHMDFKVTALKRITPSLHSIHWNCFPGKTYKIQTSTTPNGGWDFVKSPDTGTDLTRTTFPDEIQTSVSMTLEPADSTRFFRVVLIN